MTDTSPAIKGLLITYLMNLSGDVLGAVNSVCYLEGKMVSVERCLAYTRIKPEIGFTKHKIDDLK